jgi:hypothetical protein
MRVLILACPTPLAPYDGLGREGEGGFAMESHVLAQSLFRRAEPWIDNRIEVSQSICYKFEQRARTRLDSSSYLLSASSLHVIAYGRYT